MRWFTDVSRLAAASWSCLCRSAGKRTAVVTRGSRYFFGLAMLLSPPARTTIEDKRAFLLDFARVNCLSDRRLGSYDPPGQHGKGVYRGCTNTCSSYRIQTLEIDRASRETRLSPILGDAREQERNQ